MAQTDKAKQSNGDPVKIPEPTMDERLMEIIAPLQQSIQEIQQNQQSTVKAKVQEEKDEEKQRQDAASDIRNLLSEIDIDDTEDKFSQLSNKQLIDVICDAFDTAMGARTSQLEERISANMSPNNERLDKIQKVLMHVIAGLGLQETRAKFQDFDQFKEDIGKVMQTYPGMSYEDAYMLAKTKKAGDVPPRGETEAERPGDFATTPMSPGGAAVPGNLAAHTMSGRGSESRQDTSPVAGIVNFRSMVDRAADRVLSPKK